MKRIFLLIPIIALTVISCKNEKNKIIENYSSNVVKSISDTILDYSTQKSKNKAFLDSLISNSEFKNDSKIIEEIYNNVEVKNIDNLTKEKIIINIKNKLKQKDVFFISNLTNIWSVVKAKFDDHKIEIWETQIDIYRGNQTLFSEKSPYKIRIDNDGKVFIECKIGENEDVLDFAKNEKDEYYLDFKNYRLWLNEEKKEKKTENKKAKEEKESQSEMSEEEQAEQGDVIENEIVVGIKDKIYFYSNPNYDSKTKSYFVKGQNAEYDFNADDNVDDEFLYVNFEFNGKIKSGYILKSDVEYKY
jgi:hypothetical protein